MLIKDARGVSSPLRHRHPGWRDVIACALQATEIGQVYFISALLFSRVHHPPLTCFYPQVEHTTCRGFLSIWTLYGTWRRLQKPVETVHIIAVAIKCVDVQCHQLSKATLEHVASALCHLLADNCIVFYTCTCEDLGKCSFVIVKHREAICLHGF